MQPTESNNVIKIWRAEDAPTPLQFAIDRHMADFVVNVPPVAGEWTDKGWTWADEWWATHALFQDCWGPTLVKLQAADGGLIIMGGGVE